MTATDEACAAETQEDTMRYIIAAVLIAAVATAAFRIAPQTLKECVLDQMRGQPDRMIGIAVALCEQRHPDLVGKEALY